MTEFEPTTLLRLRLEEEIHSTQKLQESQEEIEAFLQENSDPDFEQAYVENREVLARKLVCIHELHHKLMKKDPAYRQEKSKRADLTSLVDGMRLSNLSEVQVEPVIREDFVSSNETMSASTITITTESSKHGDHDNDGGVYL